MLVESPMKDYQKLPAELQKERDIGILKEQNIYDNGFRNGKYYSEKKQWSTLVQINQGRYIVSWFLGNEEWNHVYENSEKKEAEKDFKSILMEEDTELQDDKFENALDILERISQEDPEIVEDALKPLISAFYQENLTIKSQVLDVFITLANKNLDIIKSSVKTILMQYPKENIQIKKKILILYAEIAVKDPSFIKDTLQIIIEDLSLNDKAFTIVLLSILNKIGKSNKELIKIAQNYIIKLAQNEDLSIRNLAKNILINLGM